MLSTEKIAVLLIEDEAFDVRRIRSTIAPFREKIQITDIVSDGRSALDLLDSGKSYDIVIMDFQIAGGIRGEGLIRKLKEVDPTLQIIVITKMTMNATDFDFANRLLEAGAMWYCTKYPGDIEDYIYQPTDFILSIFNAFEKKKLHSDKLKTKVRLKHKADEMLQQKPIVGESVLTREMLSRIAQYSNTGANVLILGESGTGKELVACHIHFRSHRSLENFVPINCGSLPDNLIESELFGFEKGAFTGAVGSKKGLFEIANGGTIFLDEVSELPLAAQAKLLRVIQEGEIDKIGRTKRMKVDVRVIAASNKDLYQEVRDRRFREDLYYRLNVARIDVPALRQRPEDIKSLISHFIRLFAADMKTDEPVLEDDVMALLCRFEWPGNIRQLQNVVQRLLFSGKDRIDREAAIEALGLSAEQSASRGHEVMAWRADNILPWREIERIVQKEYFQFVRRSTRSDAEAARKLGLAPSNYHRMCKKLGLK